ncbi:helix-turn-helix transcriptional regulator [Naasia aerilata]|nr:AraC family transcriptional regulator [Naasia aerilata]
MSTGERVRAWRPAVPQVSEVLHARFVGHSYPAHTHAEWTLLLVDSGEVAYRLDRHDLRTGGALVTLLPPGVPHDGQSAQPSVGFQKRVAYLTEDWLGAGAVGRAVDRPAIQRADVLEGVRRLHAALATPGEELAAESLVHRTAELVRAHLGSTPLDTGPRADRGLARRFREVLDADPIAPPTLVAAGALLGVHPSSLSRVFARAYGLPPHRYVTGRRVDLARHLLLDGASPADAAALAGFSDQAHLTRHFRRTLGVTPAAFARSGAHRGLVA